MSKPTKTHISFSGSLQPDDAEKLIGIINDMVTRRPANCGSFMAITHMTLDESDPEMKAFTFEEYEVVMPLKANWDKPPEEGAAIE